MASKAETIRREIQRSNSPLARHSINQVKTKLESEGDVRAHGMNFSDRKREDRRASIRVQRRQATYDSITKGFYDLADKSDEEIIAENLPDLEETVEIITSRRPHTLFTITIVDFSDLKPSQQAFGEPEFFRK